MRIKMYYPEALFEKKQKAYCFELLKSKIRAEEKSRENDEMIQSMISWTTEEEADLWVLPMDWNYYYLHKMEKDALQFCKKAHLNQKKVLSFTGGDYGISVSTPPNVIIYRITGYSSRLRKQERIFPFYLTDPVQKFFGREEEFVLKRSLSESPIIGFCGMAPGDWKTRLQEPAKIFVRNLASTFKFLPYDRQAILSSSYLRHKILKRLENAKQFETNFIIRQQYRAGAKKIEERKKTTEEYYQNQYESDLNVCVRGGGNFSVRFIETLAMGRIPLFCDTNSPLPEINGNWNNHIIRFVPSQIHKLPEIINDWIHGKDLHSTFLINRQLWKEQLSLQGFWMRELRRYFN